MRVVPALPPVAAAAEGLVVVAGDLRGRRRPALGHEVWLLRRLGQHEWLERDERPDVPEGLDAALHGRADALLEGRVAQALGVQLRPDVFQLPLEESVQHPAQLELVARDRRDRAVRGGDLVPEAAAREGAGEHGGLALRHVPRAVDLVERAHPRRLAEGLRDQ